MSLRTYRHAVPFHVMSPQDVLWVVHYAHEALQAAERRKPVKNPKSKVDYLKAQKLSCLAFARHYGLGDQWTRHHQRLSLYPPDVDFKVAGHTIRIVAAPAREGNAFGANLAGRLWEKDFERGHSLYVLAAWYPPYVDLVGWLPREEVKAYKNQFWYQIEEPVVRAMETIPGLKPRV